MLDNCYEKILAEKNMWLAWRRFRKGKRHKRDVQEFERELESHFLAIQRDLLSGSYAHGAYRTFIVHDPKRREINAPVIRDQLVHQMIWNVLFPFFNNRFSPSVYSCRPERGTHAVVAKIQKIRRRYPYRTEVWAMHLDIRKFFDTVPHDRLLEALRFWIGCPHTMALLETIIASRPKGIPLGNLTSQLFCNVILMSFDQALYSAGLQPRYVRYADDCLVLGDDQGEVQSIARYCEALLIELGFTSLWTVRKYHGFEALGKRFFDAGLDLRRNAKNHAEHKWFSAVQQGLSDGGNLRMLESRFQSFSGLVPAGDRRWTRRLRDVILEQSVNNYG